MKIKSYCVIFYLIIAGNNLLLAQPLQNVLNINDKGGYELNKHLYIYRTENVVTPEYIYDSVKPQEFKLLYPEKTFSLGITNSYCWTIFTLQNNTPEGISLFFEFNNPGLNVVKVFQRKDNAFQLAGMAGDHLPFDVKPFKYYDLVFPLHLDKGETKTIVAMIDNMGDNLDFMPQLLTANTFNKKVERYYIVIGSITGIMLTAFFLNIFLGISLKEKLHLLYSVYILSMLFEIYIIQGIDIQYIYPNHPLLSDIFKYLSPAIGLTLMAEVMQLFLNQTRSNSRLKIAVDILKYFIVLLIPVYLIIHFYFPDARQIKGLYQKVFALALALQLFLFFLSALEKTIQRYKPAYFYLAAIVYLWFGAIQYVINILGINVKERIEKQPNDLEIGIVLETLIVFLGIIYRYNLFKKEKEQYALELEKQSNEATKQILLTQETEQKRIALDLHDELGGNLAAIKMRIQSFDLPEHQLEDAKQLIDKASNNARYIAHNLMPPEFEQTDLSELLKNYYQNISNENICKFRFYSSGSNPQPDKQRDLMIYRIFMELSNNILKHANAKEAVCQLIYYDQYAEIMVEDNGTGLSENQQDGIGMKNIYSRVNYMKGKINIDSGKHGTTIMIQIPYK